MADLLLAVAAAGLLAALGLGLLSGVTLAPFVVALRLAEQQRSSAAVWGAVALAGSLVGLAATAVLLRAEGVPRAVALLPVLLTWLAPGVLWTAAGAGPVLGRAGRHE